MIAMFLFQYWVTFTIKKENCPCTNSRYARDIRLGDITLGLWIPLVMYLYFLYVFRNTNCKERIGLWKRIEMEEDE
jgi:hypothetical protein